MKYAVNSRGMVEALEVDKEAYPAPHHHLTDPPLPHLLSLLILLKVMSENLGAEGGAILAQN